MRTKLIFVNFRLRTYFGLCRVCKFETIFLCRVCKLETIFLTWLNLWFWDLTLKLKWTFIFKSFYKVLLHQHKYNPNQVTGQEQTNKIIDTIILHMTWFLFLPVQCPRENGLFIELFIWRVLFIFCVEGPYYKLFLCLPL